MSMHIWGTWPTLVPILHIPGFAEVEKEESGFLMPKPKVSDQL